MSKEIQERQVKEKKKKKKRIIGFIKKHKVISIIIAIVLILAIVFGIMFFTNKKDTTSYSYIRTNTLSYGSLDNSISTTGTVESAETSNVTSSLNYTVKTIAVSVGDKVKKGDIICTLDTKELEDQIEKEQNNLSKTIKSAQNSYNSAKENYDNAKKKLDNYKSELDSAKKTLNTAKTPYNSAKNSIKSYQSQYDKALKAYNKAGKDFVSAQSKYNSALTNFTNKKIDKSTLISVAKSYLNAIQNLYGGLNIGAVDISSGSSTSGSASASANSSQSFGGMASANVASSSSTTVTVTQTAEDLAKTVTAKVYSLTNTNITSTKSDNTLYKLSLKVKQLQNAKSASNYYNLESEYTTAKTAYDTVKQTYEQYKDSVTQADNQLTQVKEQLDNASQSDTLNDLKDNLSDCNIKANQDGTITALNATVGSSVSGGGSASAAAVSALGSGSSSSGGSSSAIATISNLDKLKISITISEADITNAKTGLSCYITSDASDETFQGTLTQIDPVANESGTFGAEVTVDSENSGLLVGMNASVEILVNSTDNVFSVPIDAVGNDNDNKGDYIYRKTSGEGTDMNFEKVYVTTGSKNDYYIEVSADSLKEGDVIRSTADLNEGIKTVDNSSKDDNSQDMFEKAQDMRNNMFGKSGGSSNGGQNSGNGNMPSPPNANGGQ